MNKLELAPEFIQGIDWGKLKEQKNALLEVRDHVDSFEEELTGLVHLIDALQDYAVDFCELPEEKVFNLS